MNPCHSRRIILALTPALAALAAPCTVAAAAEASPTGRDQRPPASPERIQYSQGRTLAVLANRKIDESSGLACGRRNEHVLWTHNDSGDGPRVYAFNLEGENLATCTILGATAVDWEDIASVTLGKKHYLLIADVGDNSRNRKFVTIYLVEEPPVASKRRNVTCTTRVTRSIRFTYADGPQNCESVAVDPTTRTIYLVSKAKKSKVYELPMPPGSSSRVFVAKKTASLQIRTATAADIAPDGLRAIVLNYLDAYEYTRRPQEDWSEAFARRPRKVYVPLRRQGESICYGPDGKTIYLTSEQVPTPLQVVPVKSPLKWGPSRAGLQLSLTLAKEVRTGEKLIIRLAVRNVGAAAVALPAAGNAFVYLEIGYSKEKAFITEATRPACAVARWPVELAEGEVFHFEPVDLSKTGVYPREDRRKLLAAQLSDRIDQLPKPSRRISDILLPGEPVVRFALCLPRTGQTALLLGSNKLPLAVRPPVFESLSPASQKAFLDDLLARFDRDARGAQEAHHIAVRSGTGVVPHLIQAAKDHGRPGHSRMWLATALADIPDSRAAEALIGLLDDPLAGVRYVAAYHGPKQRDTKLDKEIVRQTVRRQDSRMTALALLGFMVFRGSTPEELLRIGLDSEDGRARAAVAHALRGRASASNVARLLALLNDTDQRVRSTAARTLAAMNVRSNRVIGGLLAALDLPGELARARICAALGELTDKNLPYDPEADEPARRATLLAWKTWWAEAHGDIGRKDLRK